MVHVHGLLREKGHAGVPRPQENTHHPRTTLRPSWACPTATLVFRHQRSHQSMTHRLAESFFKTPYSFIFTLCDFIRASSSCRALSWTHCANDPTLLIHTPARALVILLGWSDNRFSLWKGKVAKPPPSAAGPISTGRIAWCRVQGSGFRVQGSGCRVAPTPPSWAAPGLSAPEEWPVKHIKC